MPSIDDSDSDLEDSIRRKTVARRTGQVEDETRDDCTRKVPVDKQYRTGSKYSLLRCLAWSHSEGALEVETERTELGHGNLKNSHEDSGALAVNRHSSCSSMHVQDNAEQEDIVTSATPLSRVLSEHRLPSDRDLASHFNRPEMQ
jgi:hypothetical protein